MPTLECEKSRLIFWKSKWYSKNEAKTWIQFNTGILSCFEQNSCWYKMFFSQPALAPTGKEKERWDARQSFEIKYRARQPPLCQAPHRLGNGLGTCRFNNSGSLRKGVQRGWTGVGRLAPTGSASAWWTERKYLQRIWASYPKAATVNLSKNPPPFSEQIIQKKQQK